MASAFFVKAFVVALDGRVVLSSLSVSTSFDGAAVVSWGDMERLSGWLLTAKPGTDSAVAHVEKMV